MIIFRIIRRYKSLYEEYKHKYEMEKRANIKLQNKIKMIINQNK